MALLLKCIYQKINYFPVLGCFSIENAILWWIYGINHIRCVSANNGWGSHLSDKNAADRKRIECNSIEIDVESIGENKAGTYNSNIVLVILISFSMAFNCSRISNLICPQAIALNSVETNWYTKLFKIPIYLTISSRSKSFQGAKHVSNIDAQNL